MSYYEIKDWSDIGSHVYSKGIITAVYSETDTANVTVEGAKDGSDIPLFYHCSDEAEERDNGAIEGAAAAFSVDDEVIVYHEAESGDPVRIIGFVDGIKPCSMGPYLLIFSKTWITHAYYTLWNVREGKVVEDLKWHDGDGDSATISFPLYAPFTFVDMVDGVVSVVFAATLTPEEKEDVINGNGLYGPFYTWLMSRPFPPDNNDPIYCPDPDHRGAPVWPTKDALSFTEAGPWDPILNPVIVPNASTGCVPVGGRFEKSCSRSNTMSVLARFNLGGLGLENIGSANAYISYSNWGPLVGPSGVAWGKYEGTLSRSESYISLPTPSKLNEPKSNSAFWTGPFVSALISSLGSFEDSHSQLYQPAINSSSRGNAWDWSIPFEWSSIVLGFVCEGCEGGRSRFTTASFSTSFETPLGSMESVDFNGGHTERWECGCNSGGIYNLGLILPIWVQNYDYETLVTPVWIVNRPHVEKNLYHCQRAVHNDVMYQIYYYSGYVQSYNVTDAYKEKYGEKIVESVESDGMTGQIGSSMWFGNPTEEGADDTDALSMSKNEQGDITGAIKALFDVVTENDPNDVVWNLSVKLFH